MTLIDRLSKLDGPNRRLDHEMHILFFVPDEKKDTVEWNHQGSYIWRPADGFINFDTVPAYTASVDAAIALARRLWPDVMYRVGNDGEGPDPSLYLGEIFIPGEQKDSYFTGRSPMDAISLCIAILRAKEASHDIG